MGCLGRASLDFICREFFQVCDARLQSLDRLALADIAVRALMVVIINTAVTGGTGAAIIGGGSKVVVRAAIVVS